MVQKWNDDDVKLDILKDQSIAVIGYGIQGRAQANNLKDSGLDVVVGLRKGGNTWKTAEEDGKMLWKFLMPQRRLILFIFLCQIWNRAISTTEISIHTLLRIRHFVFPTVRLFTGNG